jgi:hypothetical protein
MTRTKYRRDSVRHAFDCYAQVIRRDAAVQSFSHKVTGRPTYLNIIGMGAAVVPFLLQRVAAGERDWLLALREITDEDPAADARSHDEAYQAWLISCRGKGLLVAGMKPNFQYKQARNGGKRNQGKRSTKVKNAVQGDIQ